jgi:hypothetical protein
MEGVGWGVDGMGGTMWEYLTFQKFLGLEPDLSTIRFKTREIGLGFMPEGSTSLFHYLLYITILPFDIYDWKIYDSINVSYFLISIFSFYYFLRVMNVNPWISILGSIYSVSTINLYTRILGHFGFGYLGLEVLSLAFLVQYFQKSKVFYLYLFFIQYGILFQDNPYFGFFGLLFYFPIFISLFILNHKKLNYQSFFFHSSISSSIFIFLIIISYPSVFFPKIYRLFGWIYTEQGMGNIVGSSKRMLPELIFYSTKKPLSLLHSNWLNDILPVSYRKYITKDVDENTYSLGILCIFLILIGYLLIRKIGYFRKNEKSLLYSMVISTFLVMGFGFHPDLKYSLVMLTYSVASMFRVSVRAFLYYDLTIIVLVSLISGILYRSIKNRIGKIKSLTFLTFSFIIIIYESSNGHFLHQIHTARFPNTSLYYPVQSMEKGIMIETPIFTDEDIPELNYQYYFNYITHKKPLFNIQLYPKGNFYVKPMMNFIESLSWSDSQIQKLCALGVKYVSSRKPKIETMQFLDKYPFLKPGDYYVIEAQSHSKVPDFDNNSLLLLINENHLGKVYKIKGSCSDRSDLLKEFIEKGSNWNSLNL